MIIHNLVSSNSEDGSPDYLFRSRSNLVEFIVIEEEMEELNELCCACDNAATEKIDQARELKVVDPDTGQIDELWSEFMQDSELIRWSAAQEILVSGMVITLLFAFCEKSLRWLCERLVKGSEGSLKVKGPKIDGYLSVLREGCGLPFLETPEFREALRVARPLRNKFAHGEWEGFQEEVESVDLAKAFSAVSSQFSSIESAHMAT